MENVLIIGANGQIGSDLLPVLKDAGYNVYASDKEKNDKIKHILSAKQIPFFILDACDIEKMESCILKYDITQIYHLAAMVSGKAQDYPKESFDVNVGSLLNLLLIATKLRTENKKELRIFWPSSMAAYGNDPKTRQRYEIAKQFDPLLPETIYGSAKVAGEALCSYYAKREKIDIRSIRYPGLISFTTEGGGGTTDYAMFAFYNAVNNNGKYDDCFIDENIRMEFMYMHDAISATLQLMNSEKNKLREGISYNLSAPKEAGLNFTPNELAKVIQGQIPDFEINYKPDWKNRMPNAESWPISVDSSLAKEDWWDGKIEYPVQRMTENMLERVANKKLSV